MFILLGFAFIAGVVTILSPCILPLLPIILSSTATGDRKHPWGVVLGFIASFTFFTLFLTILVNLLGISANFMRYLAVAVIFGFGLVFVIPKLQLAFEIFASKLASKAASKKKPSNGPAQSGFTGGIFVGFSLGLVWTPCVGPILASVIALALTGTVTFEAFLVTFAYALGTAIPMLAILYGGRELLHRIPSLLKNLANIQKFFGVLMILTAVAIFMNWDRQFQSFVLEKFPNYGSGLTSFEDNDTVRKQLEDTGEPPLETSNGALAPEIIPGGKWFNSEPLTLEELRGKVVLIDFWTYSCINCIRTMPYLRDWHEKYADEGLVIIGVHAPEFEFEKDPQNLQDAIDDFELQHPIVQDNNFETWRAYSNRYWPAKYFINYKGEIVDTHFGEGSYTESEQLIQDLLKEAGNATNEEINTETYSINSDTPELYLGFKRMENLISPEPISKNSPVNYSVPAEIPDDKFAYSGTWTIMEEKSHPISNSHPDSNAELHLNFESQKVFLVMNPFGEETGQVNVYLDDVLVEQITVDSDRLYDIVSLENPGRHLLRLEFLDSNTEVFAFTFG